MDSVEQLQNKLVDFHWEVFHEGIFDEPYKEMYNLRGSNFTYQLLDECVRAASEGTNKSMTLLLDQQNDNFDALHELIFKAASTSYCAAAARVGKACTKLQKCCKEHNRAKCLEILEQVIQETHLLTSKFETVMELENQIIRAGGKVLKSGEPGDNRSGSD